MSTGVFLATRTHGPGWREGRALEAQDEWPAHADFMEKLASDGFVLFGGVVIETSDALLVVKADSKADIEARLAKDPWTRSGILRIESIHSWQVRLGSVT